MSRESVAPPGMPTHPTKVVVTGVPPGPTAQAIVDRYKAPLRRFHSAQQQNVKLAQEGGSRVHRSQQNWGDAIATYSNVFGQETLTLTVHPSVVEEVQRQHEVGYWKWCLVELVIDNMVGFAPELDLVHHTTSSRNIIRFAQRLPDEDHPTAPASPTVTDTSYTLSALVDLTELGGQVVVLEVRGDVQVRHIKGGDGHFQGQTGTVIGSTLYGARGMSDNMGGVNFPTGLFSPAALSGPEIKNSLRPEVANVPEHGGDTQSDNEARTLGRLANSFPEWEGVSDYVIAQTDHRQDILWLANFFINDTPTRWSFLNPRDNSALATRGVNPNTYNVYQFPVASETLYWDNANTIRKTVVTTGYNTPFGATWPLPAPAGTTQWTGQYYNGTDYYVPSWKYNHDRTMKISAVCAHHNPWDRTSHRFKQIDTIPGEQDPPINDCYRWETARYPERVKMDVVAPAVTVKTVDGIGQEAPLIGTLKIDTNSGKVTFKLGQGA